MRTALVSMIALGISLASFSAIRPAIAADQVRQEKTELHGGHVTSTEAHVFETVFAPDGVRIFEYSKDQKPVAMGKVSGTVTLTTDAKHEVKLVPNMPRKDEKAVYFCEMYDSAPQLAPGNCPNCHMKLIAQTGLFAAFDLSKAKPGSVKAVVHLTGLAGKESEVTFTESNSTSPAPVAPQEKKSPEHD